jgi:hypothetical protein
MSRLEGGGDKGFAIIFRNLRPFLKFLKHAKEQRGILAISQNEQV